MRPNVTHLVLGHDLIIDLQTTLEITPNSFTRIGGLETHASTKLKLSRVSFQLAQIDFSSN
jgi:hypothetical protein